MSLDAMNAVWLHSEQQGDNLLALLAIADNANDDGFAFPSYAHIAAKIRRSKRTAQKIVSRLLETDELSLVSSGSWGNSNVYSVNIATLRDKPRLIGKVEDSVPPDQVAAQVATSGGTEGATPTVSPEPSGIEPSGETSTAPGGADALFDAGPEQKVEDPADEKVSELWAYYFDIYGDRLNVKELTPHRRRLLTKALAAVNDDVDICKRAILGLKSYRDAHPDRSKDVSLDAVFKTRPGGSNLTDQIEWWASQIQDQGPTLPSSVPDIMRARVMDLAVTVLNAERQPDDDGVRERAASAAKELGERWGLVPVSDGQGRLHHWEQIFGHRGGDAA